MIPGITKRVYFLALLLGVAFLAAQLHYCADLSSNSAASHVCPICSTAGTAIATLSLIITMAPAINRLEIFASIVIASTEFSRVTSPRAPPNL